jgi:hypothetical protein
LLELAEQDMEAAEVYALENDSLAYYRNRRRFARRAAGHGNGGDFA